MRIQVAPQAEADLEFVWSYIATESGSVDIADRLIESITARFFLLGSHPYAGRTRDSELGAGIRSFVVEEYVIVYEVQKEAVLILRVVHGRRDLAAIFEP